jgi:hypothetical protein
MKTFVAISAGILLTLSFVATSDARPYNQRLRPTHAEVIYNHPIYDLNLSDVVSLAPEQVSDNFAYRTYRGD